MSDTHDDQEITEQDLQEMLEEAIDVIAMTLPDNPGEEYWSALRQLIETRAREIAEEEIDEDELDEDEVVEN